MLKFPRDLYSDVRVEDVAETTLVLEDGELKQCTESRRRGAFVRVYDGKRWYNSATTEPDRLQQELDTLAAMAEPNPAIGDDPVVRRFEVNRDCVLRWQAGDLRAVPVEQKLALLRSYQPLLERSGLAATRARYLDVHVDKTFRSSLGADIRQDYQHCGIALGYTVTGANAPFTNGQQRYASDFAGLQGCQEGLRAAIAEDVNYAMHAVPVEPGEYTCVLSPTVAGVFAHESFGHKSESDFMLGSETMRREWELGKQVGWEGLSILDSGVPNGSGYCPYDDEGTRARDTYLVKNGVLTGRLHSAATAAARGRGRPVYPGLLPRLRHVDIYDRSGARLPHPRRKTGRAGAGQRDLRQCDADAASDRRRDGRDGAAQPVHGRLRQNGAVAAARRVRRAVPAGARPEGAVRRRRRCKRSFIRSREARFL